MVGGRERDENMVVTRIVEKLFFEFTDPCVCGWLVRSDFIIDIKLKNTCKTE